MRATNAANTILSKQKYAINLDFLGVVSEANFCIRRLLNRFRSAFADCAQLYIVYQLVELRKVKENLRRSIYSIAYLFAYGISITRL